MDAISAWTASTTAKSTISGRSSLSCSFKGSLTFTVFLSQVKSSQEAGAPVIPQNLVAGRMAGVFDAEVSTPTRQVTGNGTAGWTVGGEYDPATETVSIAIRSSGANAKGVETPLGDSAQGVTTMAQSFSMAIDWGWPAPTTADLSTILNAMKPPTVPVIPSEREADLCMVGSLPQTGLKEFQRLTLDLKESKPQTVSQTFQDETGWGTRTTTWEFTLIPQFNIERDDRTTDGRHSLVSTDSISLRMAILGVTVAKSGWANLTSWEVEGLGPFSGSGVPNRLPHSTTFTFQPNPGTRPTSGSKVRNRPIQYDVSAVFEGIKQHFILTQDDVDLLRQEYIDLEEVRVPSRSEFVPYAVDGALNLGNYNLILDDGMRVALDKVTARFKELGAGTVKVLGGFSSPQRNKIAGGSRGDGRAFGRSLDLAPQPADIGGWKALRESCARAGYDCVFEEAPGKPVSIDDAKVKQAHVTWSQSHDKGEE